MKCYLIHRFFFRDARVFASRGPNTVFMKEECPLNTNTF